MENKTCPVCGNKIDADATFCTFCGTAQTPSRTEAFPPEAKPQQWPRPETSAQPKSSPTPPEPLTPKSPATHSAPPTPPVSPITVTVMPEQAEEGSGMGWIIFLRVWFWIVFAALILSSIYIGINIMDHGDEFAGLMTIVVGFLTGLMVIASGMVALNNASNQRKTANNTAKILRLLQNQNRK